MAMIIDGEKDVIYDKRNDYRLYVRVWTTDGCGRYDFYMNAVQVSQDCKLLGCFNIGGQRYFIADSRDVKPGGQAFVATGYRLPNAGPNNSRIAVKISERLEVATREWIISDKVIMIEVDNTEENAKIGYFPQYYGFGYCGNTSFMPMEYCNTSLAEFAFKAKQPRMNDATLCHIITMLHRAWTYIEARKSIVHNDLKIDNIMIDTVLKEDKDKKLQEFIKKVILIDWGLAMEENDSKASGGTVPYMSPEKLAAIKEKKQFTDKEARLSDLWSMGILAYRLITGVFPFSKEQLEVLSNCVNNPLKGQDYIKKHLTFNKNRIHSEKCRKRAVYLGGISENIDLYTQGFIRTLLKFDPNQRKYEEFKKLSMEKPGKNCHLWLLEEDHLQESFATGEFMAASSTDCTDVDDPPRFLPPQQSIQSEELDPIQPYPGVPVTCYTAAILKTPEGVMEAVYKALTGVFVDHIKSFSSYNMNQDKDIDEVSIYHHDFSTASPETKDWSQVGHVFISYPCEEKFGIMVSMYKYSIDGAMKPLLVCRRMYGDAGLYSKLFNTCLIGDILKEYLEELVYLS